MRDSKIGDIYEGVEGTGYDRVVLDLPEQAREPARRTYQNSLPRLIRG